VARDELTSRFDTVMVAAVRAFQEHHFSGRRRRYRLRGAKGVELGFPVAGTLDGETVQRIIDVWWAVQLNAI
jgi:hypothetical protein